MALPGQVVFVCAVLAASPDAAEWARFRGPNGAGISHDPAVPTHWSDDQNLAWKVELPGPGSSSPIVVGDLVLVTCYSGYGIDAERPGELRNLKRHVIAFDAHSGAERWKVTVDGTPNEDPYRGFIGEHGYASSSPVSDGRRIFVFFGKAGVLAFDLDGSRLWQTSVGTESGPQRWGTAASPIIHDNLVIVNASEESSALVALDQETGKEVWRAEADGLRSSWGTPIVVRTEDRVDIVLGVPNEIWGFNPRSGKLRWFAEAPADNTYCSSVVTDGKRIFAIEGRSGEAIAIRVGGGKDVSRSHLAWRSRGQNRISTPVVYEGRLYAVSRGVVQCLDAETGKQVYQKRLSASVAVDEPRQERGGRFGRGGPGGQDYASPIVVNGKLYFVTRSGLTHVWEAGPDFRLVAQNRFASDEGRYNGTPAVSNGRLYLRSDKALYCVAKR
jgi:outer membrane protein assembly factor BamB